MELEAREVHPASETVRGSLLTISDCAKSIKMLRRLRHKAAPSADSAGHAVLLALAQRFTASGLAVRLADGGRFITIDGVALFAGGGEGACACVPGAHLHIMDGRPDRHLGVTDLGCLSASRVLARRSPRLVLSAARGWTSSMRACGCHMALASLGAAAYAAEHKPGRLHNTILRLTASEGPERENWLTALCAGHKNALAYACLDAAFGKRVEPDYDNAVKALLRWGLAAAEARSLTRWAFAKKQAGGIRQAD